MIKIAIILVFISSSVFSQPAGTSGLIGADIRDHMLIQLAKQNERTDMEYEGSLYLNETFVIGQVNTFNKKFEGIPMRYNIFDDNIEFKQNNTVFLLIPEPRIKKVQLGGETYVVEKHEIKGDVKFGFLTLLDSGKVALMSKKIIQFTPRQEAKALQSAATPAKFVKAPDVYFCKIGKGSVMKIGTLKNLIASLPDKQDEMNQFAKKEKLSAKKEEDLLKLIKYYNSL